MLARLLIGMLALWLTACPSGYKYEVESSYGLVDLPKRSFTDLRKTVQYPTFELSGNVLFTSSVLNARKKDELGRLDKFEMLFTLGAKKGGELDIDSFRIVKDDGRELKPLIKQSTPSQYYNHIKNQNVFGCDPFKKSVVTGTIIMPVMAENEPSLDNSTALVCLTLEFDVTQREMDPERKFRLLFDYVADGHKHGATIYYYPFQYGYFSS